MSDDLPQITDERLGEMIMNAIMYSHLFEPECPECGRRGGMVQIGAFVREHFPRANGDSMMNTSAKPWVRHPQQCEPFVTFTYQSRCGKVIAEWDGGLGPIQIWYECAADFMDGTGDKAQPHWFFEYAHGTGHWSQLAVEEAGLPQMFVRGDFAGIFAVLKEWADKKSGAERA